MQYGLGVDLGTTQTAAAVRMDGRIEVVRLGGRRPEIPSLIFVKPDGGLLIGDAADRRGQAEPARLAREFKRRIGDPVPILVGGAPFSAHALTAKLLRHVLDSVAQLQGDPPAVVTVTHPANWGPYKREQLDQAIRLADAGPVLLRTEPEAAALQHATARKIASGETVAVYDLGGGTFDAAVLRREGDGFLLLGEPEGIEQLGGIDFDEAVFGHVIGVLGDKAEGLDPADPEVVTALARLRRDCVEAKEALSFDTEVMIPVALPGLHTRVRLNRSELESMIVPSLEDTVAAMHRALRSAQITSGDLSAVLLAGGSSRIPMVAQLLSTAFERPVVADPHPEHSIAMGAAVATATVTGGVSPFAAAVTPPATERRGPAGGKASAAPARAGGSPAAAVVAGAAAGSAAAAAPGRAAAGQGAAPAPGAAAARSATPVIGGSTPVQPGRGGAGVPTGSAPGGSTTYGNGAGKAGSSVRNGGPGTLPAQPGVTRVDHNLAGTTQVSGAPAGAPPVSGAPAGAPAAGTQSVAYSRGSAAIPGASGRAATPAAPGGPTVYPPGPPGAPPPTDTPSGGRGNTRKLLMIGAVVVALLAAGGTAAAVAMSGDDPNDQSQGQGSGTPPSNPVSASAAAPVQPFPTDTMLVRVDSGAGFPNSDTSIAILTPGTAARTTIPNTVGDYLPEWSNDRKQLAVTKRLAGTNEIWVMNTDGSNRRKVIENVTGGRVAWSADDTKLAFMRKVGDFAQIHSVVIGESTARQLTRSNVEKDDPAWSPDGKSIAYWRMVDGVRQIHILNVDNPQEPGRQVTSGESGPGVDPAWTPDGTRIAYTHGTGPGKSDIWVADIDGSNAAALTNHPDREQDPSWSPDGTWLAFARGPVETPKITIVKADGSDERTLTTGSNREGHPCWA